MAQMGRLMRKIQCQLAYSTNQPPKLGPTMGPSKPGMAIKLMAAKNSLRGTARNTASLPTGINMAAPMPCTTRAAIKAANWLETAHSSEPMANKTKDAVNTRRVPQRSASQPEAGISSAMVRV